MVMEGCVKCLSPQNPFGVSGVNSIAAKSNTIEVNDWFFKHKKTQKTPPLHRHSGKKMSEFSFLGELSL